MLELSLSVVAWISVVLVQAIVHYVVLGSRRGQAVGGAQDETLEECLSLATAETAEDADASFNVQDGGYQGIVAPADPSTPVLMGEKEIFTPEPEQFLELLDQTGTELLKSRSVQYLVEEQVRAIAQ